MRTLLLSLAALLALAAPTLGWARYGGEYWLPEPPVQITPTRAEVAPTGTDLRDLLQISRDPDLIKALQLLANSPYRDAVTRLQQQRGHVIYKDLRLMGKQFKDFDALSWISPNGEWMVFVNFRHQGSPPQALAALLAHETLHNDAVNSMAEEISGWTKEAETWRWFVERDAMLPTWQTHYALVKRLETLRAALANHSLEALVRSNPGYATLPATEAAATTGGPATSAVAAPAVAKPSAPQKLSPIRQLQSVLSGPQPF